MINFPFGTNGKLIILGVPILKHITVVMAFQKFTFIVKYCPFTSTSGARSLSLISYLQRQILRILDI